MLAIIYTFEKTTVAIPWCVGGIALIAGFVLLRRPIALRFKILSFVIAAVALVIVGPAMLNDKIEITSESFYLRVGFWWSPNVHRFAFKDAQDIKVVTLPDLKGRPSKYMRVTLKNGIQDDIPMGDLFRSHESDILKAVADAIAAAS